ncbi:MAG: futalosine hydrolase [bacterium]
MEHFNPMKILIVAATHFEIRPLTTRLTVSGVGESNFMTTRFEDLETDILVTGIGMTHTAYHLGRALALKKYDLAINMGIAGAYDPGVELGKVVHVTSDCFAELGAEQGERILTFYEMGLMDPDAFPYRAGRLVNVHRPDLHVLRSLPEMSGNTVNQIRTSPEWLASLKIQFPAGIETMEGAAFFYGCLNEGIPCLQIRAVSNHVHERDQSKWKISTAIENVNKAVIQILLELCT